jgi:hypothetical protein
MQISYILLIARFMIDMIIKTCNFDPDVYLSHYVLFVLLLVGSLNWIFTALICSDN